MQKKGICSFIGISAFLLASCGEENPAVFPMDSTASEATSSSIQNAENSSSSLATSTLSSSEQTESSSQIILSSSLTVEQSSSSVDAISSNSNLSSSVIGPVSFGEMTDERDGQVYKTVKIGTQTWMAENLNYAYPHKGRRTDSISWCYNNVSDNCAKYGRLYTWEAAMDCHTQFGDDYEKCRRFHGNAMNNSLDRNNYKYKGLCPENWHIPSGNEWDTLLSTATITDLKSTSGWSNEDNGTNIFRFSLLPAGIYEREAEIEEGFWSDDGAITCFWTPGQVQFKLDDPGNFDNPLAYCFYDDKKSLDDIFFYTSALSVRCVKDAETSK